LSQLFLGLHQASSEIKIWMFCGEAFLGLDYISGLLFQGTTHIISFIGAKKKKTI